MSLQVSITWSNKSIVVVNRKIYSRKNLKLTKCVFVCACVRERVRVRVRARMCVCVRARASVHARIHTHIHTYVRQNQDTLN